MDVRSIVSESNLVLEMTEKENISFVEYSEDVIEGLKALSEINFITENNKREIVLSLCRHSGKAKFIVEAFCNLNQLELAEEKTDDFTIDDTGVGYIEAICKSATDAEHALQLTVGVYLLLKAGIYSAKIKVFCQHLPDKLNNIIPAILYLYEAKQLTDENFSLVKNQVSDLLLNGLDIIKEANLLNNEKNNFKALREYSRISNDFIININILKLLQENNALTQICFETLCENPKKRVPQSILEILIQEKIIDDDTIIALFKLTNQLMNNDIRPIIELLNRLQQNNILSKKSFITLCEFSGDLDNLAIVHTILTILEKDNSCSEENFIHLQKKINSISHTDTYTQLVDCVVFLHKNKCLKDYFSLLCEQKNFASLLRGLENTDDWNKDVVKLLIENADYASSLVPGINILNSVKIANSDNLKAFCQVGTNGHSVIHILTSALINLRSQDTLTHATFNILIQYREYANALADVINQLNQTQLFNTLQSKINDNKKLAEIIFLLQFIDNNEWNNIINHKTIEEMYQYIIGDTNQLDEHIKIAAYFTLHHEMIMNEFSQEKIQHSLSNLQPDSLRDKLKTILNKLGGYSFMPDDQKNITLGVEIEYSNVPAHYKSLTEFVMQLIQKKWSHPGDKSITQIGTFTYLGESTTPIISNNSDLKAAMLNVAFLQAMDAQTNSSCGLHVHIGVENIATPDEYKYDTTAKKRMDRGRSKTLTEYQFEFIKQFLMIYKREEKQFTSIERYIDDPESYSESIVVPKNLKDIKNLNTLIEEINSSRYHEFNLYAFDKHGTIEIRRFSGTTDESEIYATISMISAMAKEAQIRTNHIFDLQLHSESEQKDQKTDDEDSLPLSFVTQQKTERERELFMLRVKSIYECQIVIVHDKNEIENQHSNNTAYFYLTNNGNDLGYVFYNKEGLKKTGIIYNDEDQHDKRFHPIIGKIIQSNAISPGEKNILLYEIALQSEALISHRIDKLKQIDHHSRLFSNFIKNHKNKIEEKNKVEQSQNNTETDNTVKLHVRGK